MCATNDDWQWIVATTTTEAGNDLSFHSAGLFPHYLLSRMWSFHIYASSTCHFLNALSSSVVCALYRIALYERHLPVVIVIALFVIAVAMRSFPLKVLQNVS